MTDKLILSDAVYQLLEGRPNISLKINGREANIFWEQKYTTFNAGFICCNIAEDNFLPPHNLPITLDDGSQYLQPLNNFTDDPRVMKLYLYATRNDIEHNTPLVIPEI